MHDITFIGRAHNEQLPGIEEPVEPTSQSSARGPGAGLHVGVVREVNAGERRVALVPKTVAALIDKGFDVTVEAGAGVAALIPDEMYVAAGASIGDAWTANVVVKVASPTERELSKLSRGQMLIGFLAPRDADSKIGALKAAGVQGFAMEAIPRISRAQAMDALSSQANVAGYKAVLVAANESPRFFPMSTTESFR